MQTGRRGGRGDADDASAAAESKTALQGVALDTLKILFPDSTTVFLTHLAQEESVLMFRNVSRKKATAYLTKPQVLLVLDRALNRLLANDPRTIGIKNTKTSGLSTDGGETVRSDWPDYITDWLSSDEFTAALVGAVKEDDDWKAFVTASENAPKIGGSGGVKRSAPTTNDVAEAPAPPAAEAAADSKKKPKGGKAKAEKPQEEPVAQAANGDAQVAQAAPAEGEGEKEDGKPPAKKAKRAPQNEKQPPKQKKGKEEEPSAPSVQEDGAGGGKEEQKKEPPKPKEARGKRASKDDDEAAAKDEPHMGRGARAKKAKTDDDYVDTVPSPVRAKKPAAASSSSKPAPAPVPAPAPAPAKSRDKKPKPTDEESYTEAVRLHLIKAVRKAGSEEKKLDFCRAYTAIVKRYDVALEVIKDAIKGDVDVEEVAETILTGMAKVSDIPAAAEVPAPGEAASATE